MPDQRRLRRRRELIFWTLAGGYLLVYFHRLCPAAVAVDMMRDLGAGGALAGVIGSAYFYPYAVMQLPAGLLSDSWGPRRTVTVFFLLAVVGSLMLGVAPSMGWAVAGRILVGLGASMVFVSTLKVLAEWFPPREFVFRTATLMAMGGLGSLTATAPLAMFSARVGWRVAFIAVGAVTLLLTILLWLAVRDRPSELGWKLPGGACSVSTPSLPLGEGLRRVLATPAFWPLAIWFFGECAFFFSFSGLWAGPYLQHLYGLTRAQVGQVLSLVAVGIMVGSPLHGYVSSRVVRARKPVIVGSSAVSLGLAAALAFRTEDLSLVGLCLLCLGVGLFTGSVATIAFAATKELFPLQLAGTATGLVNLFPFAGGAVFQPLVGHVLESHGRIAGAFTAEGYREAFLALFACAAMGLVASFFLRETLVVQGAP